MDVKKIIDSNIWIARFDKNDSTHEVALKVFESLNSQILITQFIISEVSTILQFKLWKEYSNSFLNWILKSENIEILEEIESFELINFYTKNDFKKLSFIDHSLLLLSKEFEIITFDKDLNKLIKKINA